MISSSNLAWSLTIYSAASSLYTLRAMTIVALILVPVVLAYQAWSYWVFRKRVEGKPEHLTY
jgi:cytochrome d ubiquinol oxidase subunit II